MSAPSLRAAQRALLRQPAFVAGAVLTLALAIGATTATFAIVDALLFRPLPLPDADRLVRVESVRGGQPGSLSYREVLDMQSLSSIFVDVAAFSDQGQYNASGDGRPEELVSTITTQNLFRVVGVAPAVGNPWPAEMDRTRGFEVLISDALWERRFQRDPQIVGRTLVLDGAPGYTIRGVMPPGFAFPVRADLYRSHGIAANAATYEDRGNRARWGLARLRPGVSVSQANAALGTLAAQLERDWPSTNTGLGFRVAPLRDMYLGEAKPFLLLILGAVALVLVLACVNVTNLFLVHAVAREREVAVRLALGATRAAASRFLLVEGLIVAGIGGALGVLIALVGVPTLGRLIYADLPIWLSLELSWRAIGVALIVTVLTGLVTGATAVSRTRQGELSAVLKSGGRAASGGLKHRRVRTVLVVSQVAFATMLMVGAGLLLRSLLALTATSPGFDPSSLLTFRVELGWRAYPNLASKVRFEEEMSRRLADLPGVTSVGMTANLPLDGRPTTDRSVRIAGEDADAQRRNPFVNSNVVSPKYFETMRIRVLDGRVLSPDDRDGTSRVAVVSRATAERLWPGTRAVGQRFMLGDLDTVTAWREVVGVVDDVRRDGLVRPPALDVYLSHAQDGTGSQYFVVRTQGDPMTLATAASQLTWSIDKDQSFFDVRTMQDRLRERTWVPRLATVTVVAYALLAAAIAAVGVFAMLGYTVALRRQEFGVRQALGAAPAQLMRLVLREGMRIVLIGCAIGVVLAVGLARTLEHLLVEVGALDPVVLLLAPAFLLGVALVACVVPARRAAKVLPVAALAEG